jgi:hypothetical protein
LGAADAPYRYRHHLDHQPSRKGKEKERKENERKENERKENERKENERKENMKMRMRESTHASAHSTVSSSRGPFQTRAFITAVPPSTPTTVPAVTASLAHTKPSQRSLTISESRENQSTPQ